jgi:hypothetical protein
MPDLRSTQFYGRRESACCLGEAGVTGTWLDSLRRNLVARGPRGRSMQGDEWGNGSEQGWIRGQLDESGAKRSLVRQGKNDTWVGTSPKAGLCEKKKKKCVVRPFFAPLMRLGAMGP